MKGKSVLWVLLVVVAVIAAIGLVIWRTTHMEEGTLVYTDQVIASEAESYVYASGKVVASEDRSVYAQVPGLIETVSVSLGQQVQKGEVLATLDSEDLDQRIAAARIQLSIAQENLNQSQNAGKLNYDLPLKTAQAAYEDAVKLVEDQQALFDAGAISQSELDQAKRQLERAEIEKLSAERGYSGYGQGSVLRIQNLSVSSARLALEELQSQKEKLLIKSPANGVVYAINAQPGEQAAQTMPLFSVASSDQLKVTATISEYDIASVEEGQSVLIRSDGFTETYQGVVSYISEVAENVISGQAAETVVAIEVAFQDQETKFRPNYSASMEILTAKKSEALMVPYEAVYTDAQGVRRIFVIEEGTARARIVTLGIEGDLNVEVLGDGLAEGDVIILNPTETLKDGDPVKAIEVE
ncbi:efflux RND transporter periplasmic adaptor subunit [Acidaminobacter hydrogenoformans]|uniref:RND family efflux transporter, MFP subunit n=1 Tax=Acidaminobacter hydrogenoformans DSM 2784 TaxID=1120920 RepID=A0A1G5S2F6_9FIRM|nr:efflux RND transporter periplasmic adaptor subunit [Acidaminobacter hydrogenoformans]SCZ80544.1 RND family efflux transporter, MFP subunit [Acidaminobacter hydrogenoformans DSM 2784]